MNWKELTQFIDNRPEYFEEVDGRRRIQQRHAASLKTYSRLLDPDTFDEIHHRADAVLQERERQIREQLVEMESLLDSLKKRRDNLRQRIRETAAQPSRKVCSTTTPNRARRPSRRRRHSLWWPILLDLAGALFLYLGILGYDGVSVSFIILGSLLIGWGFWLSARIPAPSENVGPSRSEAAATETPSVNKRRILLQTERKLLKRQIMELEQDIERMKKLLQPHAADIKAP